MNDNIFGKILFASIILLLCLGILSSIMRVFETKRQANEEGHRGIKAEKEIAERKMQDYWSITKIDEMKEEENVGIINREKEEGRCFATGCSNEICSSEKTSSPCIWKQEYICYQDAICAHNEEGVCSWQKTPELLNCLANFNN